MRRGERFHRQSRWWCTGDDDVGCLGGVTLAIEKQVLKVKLKCLWNQTWKFTPFSKSRQKCQVPSMYGVVFVVTVGKHIHGSYAEWTTISTILRVQTVFLLVPPSKNCQFKCFLVVQEMVQKPTGSYRLCRPFISYITHSFCSNDLTPNGTFHEEFHSFQGFSIVVCHTYM